MVQLITLLICLVQGIVNPSTNSPSYKQAHRHAVHFVEAGNRYGIDPILMVAICRFESRCQPEVESAAGDLGIMQIRPGGAIPYHLMWLPKKYLKDPYINITLAARHLAFWKNKCGGEVEHWLGQYAGVPCGKPSTYVNKVAPLYRHLQSKVAWARES